MHTSFRQTLPRILAALSVSLLALSSPEVFAFEDRTHASATFGADRLYRLFLPEDYETSGADYPVVYFMHGWGGTHVNFTNKEERFTDADVQRFCDQQKIIFVALNGQYGGSHPYNVGEPDAAFHGRRSSGDKFWVAHQAQYKDYILELVAHIDETLRTKADRGNRVIWGQSMGGFMSHLVAGLYPHLFGISVMTAPSPRFFVGYPGRAVLYSLGPAYMNHHGVHLRFHNTTTGELHFMNDETHAYALRERGLEYSYKAYPGDHGGGTVLAAMEEALAWVSPRLGNPLPRPERWHHADLYPSFDIWGYFVSSNLNQYSFKEHGYVVLRGVTERGMSVRTRQWLPDGSLVAEVDVNVTTDGIYRPLEEYQLLDYNQTQDVKTIETVTSDANGQVSFSVNHEVHQIGIFQEGDSAEVVQGGYRIDGANQFLRESQAGVMKFRVLNRGGRPASDVKVTIETDYPGVTLSTPVVELGDLESGEVRWSEEGVTIIADVSAPDKRQPLSVRLHLNFVDGEGNEWEDEIDVPIFYDLSVTEDFLIDDGVGIPNSMRLQADSKARGRGNGNGIAEPGETIAIYMDSAEGNTRTRAYFEPNPYVKEIFFPDIQIEPGTWIDGHYNTSLLEISPDCPPDFELSLQLMFETNDASAGDDPFVKELNWRKVRLVLNPSESFWSESPRVGETAWRYSGQGYEEPGIGWIFDGFWPWIYTNGIDLLGEWLYVLTEGGGRNGFYAYAEKSGCWLYGVSAYGWYYSFETGAEGWKPFSLR